MTPRKLTKHATAERRFSEVVEALSQDPGVALGKGKGFGSGTLKVDGKIFAMLSSGSDFVVKLAKGRVDALIASGDGRRFEPQRGRLMREWLLVEPGQQNWIGLAKEACEFVRRGTPTQ